MTIEELLDRAGADYVKQIRDNLASTGTDATGETSRSVGYRVVQSGNRIRLEVYGSRPYFPTVETGSKPSTKNPSPEMVRKISKWKEIRGILRNPFAISKGILKFGSRLWQKGGRKDIYTNVRERAFAELPDRLAKVTKETIKV
jgi:hypothetical protein